MLPKAHLTSHSRMSSSRWVITLTWLSWSWSSFLYRSSVYSCHLFCHNRILLNHRNWWRSDTRYGVGDPEKHDAQQNMSDTEGSIQWACSVAQLCLTLCNPMDCSPPGSSVHGILQVRMLEWIAISFSRASSQSRDSTHVSYIGRQILYY